MGKIYGIDLGTTYSAIAVIDEFGKPEIIPNREGERITPSVVLFDDDENPLVGQLALNQAKYSPLNCIQFVKRYMADPTWKYKSDSGEEYTPEDISALILKKLKEDAEIIAGEEIKDVVITVPAYFKDSHRVATKNAGEIAGLNVVRIINEPTAAALAYGFNNPKDTQTILVFDLGGGTFDVTVMKLTPNKLEVIATGGDKNLGGFDWDNELMNYLNDEFIKQGGVDLLEDPVLCQDLRDKAELAKKTLSTRETATVFLTAGNKNISIPVTLSEFNEITKPLVKRTGTILEFVLEDAKLQWTDINKILLAGGSTRMKAIIDNIEQITGIKPSMEIHPDEAVAMGAAIQAGLLEVERGDSHLSDNDDFLPIEVSDVNSHSMGVIAVDEHQKEYNSIILEKDTIVPCKKSNQYVTVADNQTEIFVQVSQGEDTDPQYVEIAGTSNMKIPSYPKGAPVEVFFEYDIDGIIHISVVDLTTNKLLGEMELKRSGNLTSKEISEKQKRANNLKIS